MSLVAVLRVRTVGRPTAFALFTVSRMGQRRASALTAS
jgi:hypothetical protein